MNRCILQIYNKVKQIKTFVKIFLLWTVIGMLSKVFFLVVHSKLIPNPSFGDYLAVMWHGLTLDMAMAGYLTILPSIILILSIWSKCRVILMVWRAWLAFTALAVSIVFVANIALYGYWGFPLDNTPLLYLKTSPTDTLASMTTLQIIFIPILVAVVAFCIYCLLAKAGRGVFVAVKTSKKVNVITSVIMLFCTASLIIPIRGGVSTAVNHTGNAYYSTNIRLNHAAVNPMFSFFESVIHIDDIGSRYRFMDNDKAQGIFNDLTYTKLRQDAEKHDYNVVVICLEGFSKYIMEESGHVKGVVPNLERYSREGIYFTNFYANSFRTDRAIVSVFSGLPAQPTMSVMDQPHISTSLPSLARTLAKSNYDTHFYYGGDAGYSNMRSYVIGTGFKTITDQHDFDNKYVTGKWGVADGPLFDRVLDDIKKETAKSNVPFYKGIMTGSSHEPFDVPDYRKLANPALNAFSYSDYCLGKFIESLKKLPCWKNTVIVIVPDHLGAYPDNIDNTELWRYELPLIMLGGPVSAPRQVETCGSQIDICATVLGMMGKDHSDFLYSKDLFDSQAPHFAFFTVPDAMGMIQDSTFVYYDNVSKSKIRSRGINDSELLIKSQAYLQKLYDDLEARKNGK